MGIKDEIKDKLAKKKQEMRDKRLGKVLNKVENAQAKKEKEFKTIAEHLDNRMEDHENRIRKLEIKVLEGGYGNN